MSHGPESLILFMAESRRTKIASVSNGSGGSQSFVLKFHDFAQLFIYIYTQKKEKKKSCPVLLI